MKATIIYRSNYPDGSIGKGELKSHLEKIIQLLNDREEYLLEDGERFIVEDITGGETSFIISE